MAWTNPRTWLAGEKRDAAVTAEYNASIRDNLTFLAERVQAGTVTITPTSGGTARTVTVTFPVAFTRAPYVVISPAVASRLGHTDRRPGRIHRDDHTVHGHTAADKHDRHPMPLGRHPAGRLGSGRVEWFGPIPPHGSVVRFPLLASSTLTSATISVF